MTAERDYDTEIRDTSDHKYVYGFDFDVMHPLMIRSFLPFFRPGKVLSADRQDWRLDGLLPHRFQRGDCPAGYDNGLDGLVTGLQLDWDLVPGQAEAVDRKSVV